MSPAYPKYYKGGRKCKWSLKVDPGQRIQVRLLDVNLRDEMRTSRERGRGERRECSTDSIRVSEKGKNLLRMCGEMKNDILLLSHGNQLEVSFMICSLMIYHLFFMIYRLSEMLCFISISINTHKELSVDDDEIWLCNAEDSKS